MRAPVDMGSDDNDELDEEDLDLVEENTGLRVKRQVRRREGCSIPMPHHAAAVLNARVCLAPRAGNGRSAAGTHRVAVNV